MNHALLRVGILYLMTRSSAMDRWSVQNLATEAPIKKYALIVLARVIHPQ